ncbi:uncharacterized protein LOC131678320 [Topomyia yanbarensis]|uniref:uncharacterized protein LOC131678320 n=1 Tax=Topomyia yanbarensis TaxID=2498891 RepID=UPI00273C54B9|nr:uncharacterized protein LOC131678320 [Topomyia yanbarensis]
MIMFSGIAILIVGLAVSCGAVNPSSKVDFTEVGDLNDDNGFVSVFKNYPKIQVTVDTSKLKRVANPENDESSSGSSGSSGSESVERQTIGVRTDITIEVSEESANETNNVNVKVDARNKNGTEIWKSNKSEEDDDNASVPVFKGMNGLPTKGKPSRPTISNDVDDDRSRPGVTLHGRPTFVHRSDERRPGGGPYDGWNRFQPVMGVWTTERPYLRRIDYDFRGNPIYVKSYIPYHVARHDEPKPCYCGTYQQWDRAPSNPVLPTPRKKVQDKVEVPYKQHRD